MIDPCAAKPRYRSSDPSGGPGSSAKLLENAAWRPCSVEHALLNDRCLFTAVPFVGLDSFFLGAFQLYVTIIEA